MAEREYPWQEQLGTMILQNVPREIYQVDENDEIFRTVGMETLDWISCCHDKSVIIGCIAGTSITNLEFIQKMKDKFQGKNNLRL